MTPVWRGALSPDEEWNVSRTLASTAGLDHVLLAPRSLDTAWYRTAFPRSRVVRGPDAAFASTWTYSRAMLDARLYGAFSRYRFLLLAQTDAVVVRDPRPALDRAAWDYAGAPFTTVHRMSLLTTYSRRLGELEQRLRPRVVCRVGNGGLSVRRVDALERVLRRRPLLRRAARINEDLVLAHLGERGRLRLASPDQASALFFEDGAADPLASGVLGFHALERWHPDAYAALRAAGGVVSDAPGAPGAAPPSGRDR